MDTSPVVVLRSSATSKTADQLLEEALALISGYGWVQGAGYRKDEGFCITGALRHAAFGAGYWDCIPIETVVNTVSYYAACTRLLAYVEDNIIIWNDKPERTVEDVILAFKKALGNADDIPAL